MSATDELYRSYLDLRWNFDPSSATASGETREDTRLGAFDPESMRAHIAAFRAMAGAVESLEVEELQEEIDRTAFLDEIRITVFRFEKEQPHIHNPGFWLNHFYQSLHGLLRRPEVPGTQRAEAILARLKAAPAFFQAARETLKDPPRVFIGTASAMVESGRALPQGAAELAATEAPDLAPELDLACEDAETALQRFGLALGGELRAHPDDQSFAIGEDQFNRRLHHEHALTATAPELYRYGLHLVEEIAEEVAALAREVDSSLPWRSVVEKLRAEHPVDTNPLTAFREEMERARDYVASRHLARIPEAPLEVVATPPFLRPLVPFAAYDPPGALSGDRTGRFYVTAPDNGGGPLRDPCELELAATAIHEGFPGHHLQIVTAQASPSLVRRMTATPVMVEGWALYCEELMAEENYFRSPAERLFQRLHLLWRALRIVLDVGLHTRGLTPEQAADQMVDVLAMDRRKAEAEVSRYCAWPSYQLCYAVGRRELLELRADYKARAGASFTLRNFHDEVLGYGGLPVSLIRWGMGLGE
jgi:uncharacterized protein (DUF885 family)